MSPPQQWRTNPSECKSMVLARVVCTCVAVAALDGVEVEAVRGELPLRVLLCVLLLAEVAVMVKVEPHLVVVGRQPKRVTDVVRTARPRDRRRGGEATRHRILLPEHVLHGRRGRAVTAVRSRSARAAHATRRRRWRTCGCR